MRVIESNLDGFEFERAYIATIDGAPVPVAIMGGVECRIETKPGPLMDALAFCQPVNPKLADDWPVSVTVEDPENGERVLWNMTADPRVVSAARRYWELAAAGRATIGTSLE
jgi:hypothetical protein